MLSLLPVNMIISYPISIQVLYILLCFVIAMGGWNKKMGFWGYLFSSILFSPVIGLLLLLVSEKKE